MKEEAIGHYKKLFSFIILFTLSLNCLLLSYDVSVSAIDYKFDSSIDIGGYSPLFQGLLSYPNYDRTLSNLTANTGLWYKNSTDGTLVGVLAQLTLDFNVSILDDPLSPTALLFLQNQNPNFSGTIIWDAFVEYLKMTTFGSSVSSVLNDNQNITRAIRLEILSDYPIIFGFTNSVAMATFVLDVNNIWWDYLDQDSIELHLNEYFWYFIQVINALQDTWAALVTAGQPKPSFNNNSVNFLPVYLLSSLSHSLNSTLYLSKSSDFKVPNFQKTKFIMSSINKFDSVKKSALSTDYGKQPLSSTITPETDAENFISNYFGIIKNFSSNNTSTSSSQSSQQTTSDSFSSSSSSSSSQSDSTGVNSLNFYFSHIITSISFFLFLIVISVVLIISIKKRYQTSAAALSINKNTKNNKITQTYDSPKLNSLTIIKKINDLGIKDKELILTIREDIRNIPFEEQIKWLNEYLSLYNEIIEAEENSNNEK